MRRSINIFILILTVPIITFGQTKNYEDDLGRKQGLHIEYSGSLLFERTYSNDTLNGFFREFTNDGRILTTGYFKNGLKDSIWFEFYKDKSVKKKEIFKYGKKQGEFIHYYENGWISYKATFDNDLLVGDAINYFQNGTIKSIGNRKNGIWTEFYENGNLKSKQTFSNGCLLGQMLYLSNMGDTLLPRILNSKIAPKNKSIINKTDLKVYLLFDPNDSLNYPIKFGSSLFDNIVVCKNDFLTIHIRAINFQFKPEGIWVYIQNDSTCYQKIIVNEFSTNQKVKELENGDYELSYELEKKHFNSRIGKIEVERKKMQCNDTGNNPVKIFRNGKKLVFKDIGNLLLFEYDSDNDGNNELYLLNYYSCQGLLYIYKIDDK
jgi:antitoxin component YwqK of YwqJK toxin-antitoxin module